jgi:hypothetical protein
MKREAKSISCLSRTRRLVCILRLFPPDIATPAAVRYSYRFFGEPICNATM